MKTKRTPRAGTRVHTGKQRTVSGFPAVFLRGQKEKRRLIRRFFSLRQSRNDLASSFLKLAEITSFLKPLTSISQTRRPFTGEDFLNRYFSLYFTRFADELYYPMNDGLDACALLTDNAAAADAFREDRGRERFPLPQAFDTTASGYSPISEKTVSVLVPYTGTPDGRGNGNTREEEPPDEQKTGAELLAALQDLRDPQTPDEWTRAKKLLRLAQKFTVAVHEKKIGGEAGARLFVQNRGAIEFYSLAPEFYDSAPAAVGLDPELAGTMIL